MSYGGALTKALHLTTDAATGLAGRTTSSTTPVAMSAFPMPLGTWNCSRTFVFPLGCKSMVGSFFWRRCRQLHVVRRVLRGFGSGVVTAARYRGGVQCDQLSK